MRLPESKEKDMFICIVRQYLTILSSGADGSLIEVHSLLVIGAVVDKEYI
jgi:hypothetical protein